MLNEKAVLKLANFLESLPRQRFYMGQWIAGNGKDGLKFFKVATKPKKTKDPDCGTTCCIAGWQVSLMGLYLNSNGEVFKKAKDSESVGLAWEIAKNALGLETTNLFFNHELNTPKKAAKELRKMLKEETEKDDTNSRNSHAKRKP